MLREDLFLRATDHIIGALLNINFTLKIIADKLPPADSVLQQLNEELILENKELHARVMKDQRFKDKL